MTMEYPYYSRARCEFECEFRRVPITPPLDTPPVLSGVLGLTRHLDGFFLFSFFTALTPSAQFNWACMSMRLVIDIKRTHTQANFKRA
jgi:hypothetical protein